MAIWPSSSPTTFKSGGGYNTFKKYKRCARACNGAKFVVIQIKRYTLLAEFAVGQFKGERIALSRVPLAPSDGIYPFTLTRRQFPVRLAFAITINKSQGQTLKRVVVFLPLPVFSHGQLYVALSRVGSPADISVFLGNSSNSNEVTDNGAYTKNVVFKWCA